MLRWSENWSDRLLTVTTDSLSVGPATTAKLGVWNRPLSPDKAPHPSSLSFLRSALNAKASRTSALLRAGPRTSPSPGAATDVEDESKHAYPRSLQALHLQPLRREAEHGIPSCDLQLRSFSIQPLEFFSDFALRVAYYLGLPAYGPVPLPRITERWTVPRSHFIFKKAQENFERVTMRRLIQIKDGHPETVQIWLAYLQKHQMYGVGMKANMWEFSELGVGKDMDQAGRLLRQSDEPWARLGQIESLGTAERVEELLGRRRVKRTHGRLRPERRQTDALRSIGHVAAEVTKAGKDTAAPSSSRA